MNEVLYLLTGAAGFLGSNVSRSLIAKNKKVRALVLKGDPMGKYVPREAEIVSGDLLDNDSLENFFSVPSGTEIIVIHCASMVTVSPDLTPKLRAVNVEGTRNIINKCIAYHVKKLVYVSSTGAIPEPPKGQAIKEPVSFNPAKVVGGYSKTKAEATQLVLDAVKENKINASIVYPSGISGPNDYGNGYFTNFIIDFVNGKLSAGFSGSFNAVDVRDLAEAIIACIEKGRNGDGYILSNSEVFMPDLFHLISKYSGAKDVNFIVPLPIIKVIAFFGSAATKFTKKPILLTTIAIYNLIRNNNFSCEKAKNELGFKTRPFEETIRDMVVWLQTEKRI